MAASTKECGRAHWGAHAHADLAEGRLQVYHTEPWDLDLEWSWEWVGEAVRWALRPGWARRALCLAAAWTAGFAAIWAACALVWTGVGL